MALSAQQIEQFKTHGYTLVEGFFGADEVAALQAELKRLRDADLVRNVRPAAEGVDPNKVKANFQLVPMSPHSPLIKAMPFEPKVIDAVTSLIGDEIILHLDQTFVKPGLRGTGTNWHQDNAYFKINDPMQGTAMWIAVDDATLANGTMRIIPDMYHEKLEHEKDPESNHHIRCYPSPELEQQSVAFELKAGDVGFFCYGTPHCTMANNTLEDRAGIAMHFLTYEAATTGKHSEEFTNDDRDYRPYLTGPKATNGQKEYGEDMTGRWRQEVEKLIGQGAPAGV